MGRKGSHGKVFKKRMASLMIMVFWGYQILVCSPALASPQGGVVTSGTAAINQTGNVTKPKNPGLSRSRQVAQR